eukprot:CAMPEP_0184023772 /NCGR_PEP_ID=MMETSP0954-20121128/11595_1 /TAXON_ID=627963 /ORGANISM="Aplanochytrium sp, Strain PBS07" /LENGTH=493 /DNA_ID=CAMNT_0026306791 /DNA_START=137 /DNA_END=1615 /DNA_ORIENTATION=+
MNNLRRKPASRHTLHEVGPSARSERSGSRSDPKYGSKRSSLTKRNMILICLALLIPYSLFLLLEARLGPSKLKILEENDQETHQEAAVTKASEPPALPKADLIEYLPDGSPVGYIRVPRIPQGKRTSDDGKIHVIFSSGCNKFQHWQSELLLASAKYVGQRGRITRIVSGCHDKKAEDVVHRHQTFPAGDNDKLVPMELLNRSYNENFGLFVTPQFEGAIDFPWINKPSSIKYFMEHARPELDRLGETVIAILDPDFIFLEPLTQTGAQSDKDVIASRGADLFPGVNDPIDVVVKGRPVAQRYGLEAGWLKFKPLEQITGNPNSPSKEWTAKEASHYTSVGPPLMLHIDDIAELSVHWERNMRPVLRVGGPDILADMWAYSIGAADLGLKHTQLDHYMISTWGSRGQAYPWVGAYESLECNNPVKQPGLRRPTFIHLASNFKAVDSAAKEWMFHKGHVPANILDCDMPLIVQPSNDLFNDQKQNGMKAKQKAW